MILQSSVDMPTGLEIAPVIYLESDLEFGHLLQHDDEPENSDFSSNIYCLKKSLRASCH